MAPPRDSQLRLIELATAEADAASAVPMPKAGYLYRALLFPDEDAAAPDPKRFAALAFPASPASGRTMFIVSEKHVV